MGIGQKNSNVRVIGDEVLQKPGILFPDNPTPAQLQELNAQIEIAKALLIETGGAGIAANQCGEIENPYQFTIVGVYPDSEIHKQNVAKRYPDVTFPDAVVMINPKNIRKSKETTTFFHGCLSVPGQLRGMIKTPAKINLTYTTFNARNELIAVTNQTYSATAAVVLDHELNHIVDGKTYIDCCLDELSEAELNLMKDILEVELKRRNVTDDSNSNKIKNADFYRFITIDEQGQSHLDTKVLGDALKQNLSTETITGMLLQLNTELSKKCSKKKKAKL